MSGREYCDFCKMDHGPAYNCRDDYDSGGNRRLREEARIAQERREKELREKEICICAAVIAEDGTIVRGHRHCFCFQTIIYMGKQVDKRSEAQGFITSRNRYVTREEGRKLQDEAGIPSADPMGYKGNTLFSEDLY